MRLALCLLAPQTCILITPFQIRGFCYCNAHTWIAVVHGHWCYCKDSHLDCSSELQLCLLYLLKDCQATPDMDMTPCSPATFPSLNFCIPFSLQMLFISTTIAWQIYLRTSNPSSISAFSVRKDSADGSLPVNCSKSAHFWNQQWKMHLLPCYPKEIYSHSCDHDYLYQDLYQLHDCPLSRYLSPLLPSIHSIPMPDAYVTGPSQADDMVARRTLLSSLLWTYRQIVNMPFLAYRLPTATVSTLPSLQCVMVFRQQPVLCSKMYTFPWFLPPMIAHKSLVNATPFRYVLLALHV